MAQTYSVKVVGPTEWSRLAKCPHVDEDSLGFADARMGKAYVRDTHAHELNRYLVNHEFEHLLETEGTDECACGMRHKKGKDIARNVVSFGLAPVTGGLSLSLASKKGREATSKVVPNEITGLMPWVGSEQPFGRTMKASGPSLAAAGATLALGPGLGLFGKGPMAGKPIPTQTGAPGGGLASMGSAPGGAAEAAGRFVKPLAQSGFRPELAGSVKPSFFAQGGRAGATLSAMGAGGGGAPPPMGIPQALQTATGAAPTAAKASFPGGAIGKSLAIGGGLSMVGDMFAKKPQVPDFGSLPDVQALRQGLEGGQSPLGQLGRQQLSARLSSPFGGLEQGVESSIRDTFGQQRRNLISQFKALRPNADLTTDSAYRQALFELDQQEAQAIGTAKETAFQNFQQTRSTDIASALGVDAQTVETLAALANADIATIMAQLGVDAAEAQQFKQTWSQLGLVGAMGSMGAFA